MSILTPSLNQGRFLQDCLDSVSRQTYRPIEHIVMDGGSTDETLNVLSRAPAHVRWVSEPDRGQSHALNKALAMSRGEIIGWLNTDDTFLDSGVVGAALRYLDRTGADVVTGGGYRLNEDGSRRKKIAAPGSQLGRMKYVDLMLQPATFLRREVMEALPLDETLHYAFDWWLFVQAVERYKVVTVPDLWAGYRIYGVNKTAAGGSRRTWEISEVTRRNLGPDSWQYHVLSGLAAFEGRVPIKAASGVSHICRKALQIVSGGRLQT